MQSLYFVATKARSILMTVYFSNHELLDKYCNDTKVDEQKRQFQKVLKFHARHFHQNNSSLLNKGQNVLCEKLLFLTIAEKELQNQYHDPMHCKQSSIFPFSEEKCNAFCKCTIWLLFTFPFTNMVTFSSTSFLHCLSSFHAFCTFTKHTQYVCSSSLCLNTFSAQKYLLLRIHSFQVQHYRNLSVTCFFVISAVCPKARFIEEVSASFCHSHNSFSIAKLRAI